MLKKILFLPIVGVVLTTEVVTLFIMQPRYLVFNTALSTIFLFLSGAHLYDFTYRRRFATLRGVFLYGLPSIFSIVLAESITLKYASYMYSSSFPHGHVYSSSDALASALVILTSYGYPQVTGSAHAIVLVLMIYSWIVNVLLLTKLISMFQKRIT